MYSDFKVEDADYGRLKEAGHTPAKAAEIMLDAKRGDHHSIRWIKEIRRQIPQPKMTVNA